ncbi:GDP-fucose protein O-fucosyltransferase [Artemisia annua]|uniref:O-fucosyltransferase family protein n=1 Tax=Artemisia annua TaxID=35608 RepID=A0A2U1NBN7_ARTAN|nr:GDP-fucose protein O-fucosyltransferase [Artemisia annua]
MATGHKYKVFKETAREKKFAPPSESPKWQRNLIQNAAISGGTFTTPGYFATSTGQNYTVFKETATRKKFYSKQQVLNYLAIAGSSNSNKREEPGKIHLVLKYCRGSDLTMFIQRHQGRIPKATSVHFMQQQPCVYQPVWKPSEGSNCYIMVTAKGGINQQRVAVSYVYMSFQTTSLLFFVESICKNEVPLLMDDYFIDSLKPDIRIVKELPKKLQSLDLEAIGSVVTDGDIAKEAKPSVYLKFILPLLMKNRVVHFVLFGNRLASDPIPYHLQRLRCGCNFHALQFTPKIQGTAALLIQRMRQNATHSGVLYENLVGPFAKPKGKVKKYFRYLALHLRFEIVMVALSLCDFGGGEEEKKELQAYCAIHFPGLLEISWLWGIIGSQRLSFVNAVVTIGEAIIDGDHEGFRCLINSATPATCGAAILKIDIALHHLWILINLERRPVMNLSSVFRSQNRLAPLKAQMEYLLSASVDKAVRMWKLGHRPQASGDLHPATDEGLSAS